MIRDFTKTMIRVGDRIVASYERDPRLFGEFPENRQSQYRRLQRWARGRALKTSWKNRQLVEDREWTVVEVSPKTLIVENYDWRRVSVGMEQQIDLIWVSKLKEIKPVYAQMGVGRYSNGGGM